MSRPRGIVLVVPKAGSGVDQHFAHTYALAEEVARLVPTAVVVERVVGELAAPAPGVRILTQSRAESAAPLRVAELLRFGVSLRRQGFDTFFVRTSQTSAVPLAVLTRLLGGQTLYWNCVRPAKRGLSEVGWRSAIRSELPVRLAFMLADKVVTGTRSLASLYSSAHGIPARRMAVLPNEIALATYGPATEEQRIRARARLGVPEQSRMVLSVHRLSPVRQTLRYLPAVAEQVLDEIPDVVFKLVGGGPDEASLRKAIESAGLADRFILAGAVPHSQIREYYHAADAFFMPSYTEGFPRVLLEAMAMGVPFVSTDVGGVREVVPPEYRPRLTSKEDPGQMADEIVRLLRNPDLASELVERGLDWVQRYDAPVVARRLVELATEPRARAGPDTPTPTHQDP
jgi:glycosyltransferase involved in cell wall biosynthesis